MPIVDVNVPRINQAVTSSLTAVAFVRSSPELVAVAFAILVLSRVGGSRLAPITQLYVRFIRPRFQPAGPSDFEDARPPAFAQLIGAIVLGLALAGLYGGVPIVGWALTLLVTALAGLAATTRICVGCIMYERFIMEPAT
ncbi:MAG: DUF4395 domain-containing protein [Acidimicrobiia bacterium]|nr:DUF4395 domain-containing protein [Acidimicrobiia bacterium]